MIEFNQIKICGGLAGIECIYSTGELALSAVNSFFRDRKNIPLCETETFSRRLRRVYTELADRQSMCIHHFKKRNFLQWACAFDVQTNDPDMFIFSFENIKVLCRTIAHRKKSIFDRRAKFFHIGGVWSPIFKINLSRR